MTKHKIKLHMLRPPLEIEDLQMNARQQTKQHNLKLKTIRVQPNNVAWLFLDVTWASKVRLQRGEWKLPFPLIYINETYMANALMINVYLSLHIMLYGDVLH